MEQCLLSDQLILLYPQQATFWTRLGMSQVVPKRKFSQLRGAAGVYRKPGFAAPLQERDGRASLCEKTQIDKTILFWKLSNRRLYGKLVVLWFLKPS